eukprot:s4250_g2.t1
MDDLLPSELYDQEVESKVADRFSKMSEEEFAKLLKSAEFHPDFATYVRGVKTELGGDDDEWMFGRDEPYEDLLSFHVWCICRDRLRERLGLGKSEAPAKPASTPLQAPPHPAKHPAIAALPKTVVEPHPALKLQHPGQTSVPKASPSVHPAQTSAPASSVIVPQPGTMFFPEAVPKQPAAPVAETPVPPETSAPAVPKQLAVATPVAETSTPRAVPEQLAVATPVAETSTPPAVPEQLAVATPVAETLVPPVPKQLETPAVPKQLAVATPVAETAVPPETSAPAVPKQLAVEPPVASSSCTALALAPPSKAAAAPPHAAPTGAMNPPPNPPPASGLSERVDRAILEVPKEAEAKSTSATHRNEYMAYLRAARNPSKLPPALRSVFAAGGAQRLDLFQLWMEKSKDFGQVEIEIQRRNVQRQTATSRNLCLSRTQLLASGRYSEDDVNDLIRRRTESGHWIPDPNFPHREDLRQYMVNAEMAAENARVREDSQAVTSRTAASAAEAISLTEDGGDFSVHAAPTVRSLTAELSGLEHPPLVHNQQPDPTAKAKAKAKPRAKAKTGKGKGKGKAAVGEGEEGPEPDKVPTPLEKAISLKAKVLKEAEEARTLCVSIEGLECSGDLVAALTQHSNSMLGVYRDLNKLTVAGVDDETSYADLFHYASTYSAWYSKRKRVANSMKAAATTMD